ncbi:Type I secretion system membrane fusion protein PrsE [Legionella massiliensis]|uniref:Type I secretion system membrane fusion protein PrsE n=2 Tax=Legionella massiliensis TaxID=1034943 RepID=A0A078KWG7_9GAMM|nr:Type I secretion system membrane fusion protein PrsE [Legionella massiliensis]CEE11766.1 Type I secretion system membrane fusion protein PrsE [Legionella massiliensis]
MVWSIALGLAVFLIWAWQFNLDEVSSGGGTVVPSSKEQLIQSLYGGVVTNIKVSEGDIVEKNQVLAQLDLTRAQSTVEESAARLRAAQASAARLNAEVNALPLKFPPNVLKDPDLVSHEMALYHSRQLNLNESVKGFKQALSLVHQELRMTEPLVAKGAASEVEVLRLKREFNDLQNKLNELRNQYLVQAREDLAKANAEAEAQLSVVRGKSDMVDRATFRTPMRGIVKELAVTTVGGVIPPNGKLMSIVPLDEQLVIEAHISPRDVAFIHPNQRATVKISAYDYTIYGGLEGRVTMISPDTIQDEVKRDVYYYRVYVRTDSNHLSHRNGEKLPIVPGMITTVDIHTGNKTILDYLLKPLNKAKEATRERL